MANNYRIISRPRLLRDEASVKRHIESDDYFGTIATILSLVKEQIKSRPDSRTALIMKTFRDLESDLLFLQENYRITARPGSETGRAPRKAG